MQFSNATAEDGCIFFYCTVKLSEAANLIQSTKLCLFLCFSPIIYFCISYRLKDLSYFIPTSSFSQNNDLFSRGAHLTAFPSISHMGTDHLSFYYYGILWEFVLSKKQACLCLFMQRLMSDDSMQASNYTSRRTSAHRPWCTHAQRHRAHTNSPKRKRSKVINGINVRPVQTQTRLSATNLGMKDFPLHCVLCK